MVTNWTEPQEWIAGNPITAEELNEESNRLRYLYDRGGQMVTVRGNGTNPTTVSTASFAAVDDAIYAVSLETTGGKLCIDLTAHVAHSVANNFIAFDVIMDDITYMSSLTGTALTQGIITARPPAITVVYPVNVRYMVPAGIITAGVHTFKLRWKVQAATGTLWVSSGYMFQLAVSEHS